ncbi:hypothetical protein MAR_002992 [Mya arenaria]|uniref:Uncharacterized protein n=1 Tax=Mya arenaria TaxID=6604 RepID=A0ABY7G7T1_MYAAR|nr:hypothetical protein MAR_002992 [Mya arenaria]
MENIKTRLMLSVIQTKVTGKSKFRPAHFCDAMYKEIQNNHAGNNPFWMNTDSTKWQDPHVGYWEVTKCYLSSAGYFDKIGASQMDASGLLSICINSSFIKQHITNIQQFEEVRDIRNKTLHDARYEIDEKTANDCLDKMITVLQDPQELIHDTFAQRAAHLIINIKAKIEKTPAVMTETLHKWLQTNFDVDKHLKEIEGLMYDRLRKELKGFIRSNVRSNTGSMTEVTTKGNTTWRIYDNGLPSTTRKHSTARQYLPCCRTVTRDWTSFTSLQRSWSKTREK